MDELKKNIEAILNQFAQEELGNRLSQFSLISLKNFILAEIGKPIKAEDKEK